VKVKALVQALHQPLLLCELGWAVFLPGFAPVPCNTFNKPNGFVRIKLRSVVNAGGVKIAVNYDGLNALIHYTYIQPSL
jgi:hypothetical protein